MTHSPLPLRLQNRLQYRLRGLFKDETGSMAVEGVLSVLLLAGWLLVALQFFDGYRVKSLNTRAAYTISDLVSREKDIIGPKYVAEMKKVFDYVTDARGNSWIRVTGIEWSEKNKRFEVLFSEATGGRQDYTTASLQSEAGRIPMLAAGQMGIIVETSMNFNPLFGIGDKAVVMGGKTTHIGLGSNIWMSNFEARPTRNTRVLWDPAY